MVQWDLMFKMYLITISIETPILLLGLSPRHSYGRRLFCGVWLTACTYPVVWLVLPALFDIREQRGLYLVVAETFAPVAECAIFWAAFGRFDESTTMIPDASSRWRTGEPAVERGEAVTMPPAVSLSPASPPPTEESKIGLSPSPEIVRKQWLSMWRDLITITLANLASFGFGEVINRMDWEWLK